MRGPETRNEQTSYGAIRVKDLDFSIDSKTLLDQVTLQIGKNEMVGLGRYAHCGFLQSAGKEDEKICQEALEAVGMAEFMDRSFLSLSGGEKQRVYVTMAFAQQSPILLLDEPTNHLDIGYQMLLMETMHKMKRERSLTIFTSVHDMNLAAWYCSRLIVLDHGHLVAEGSQKEILTPELIRKVFHVNAAVREREDGKLQIEYQSYCNESGK